MSAHSFAQLSEREQAWALIAKEAGIHKERADHWQRLAEWVYQRAERSLRTTGGRDQALAEICHKVGAWTR